MKDIGTAVGLGTIFLIIGVALDLAKHLAPVLAIHHSEQSRPMFAGVLYTFAAALMVVSIVASATSLEKGITQVNNHSAKVSIQAMKLEEQIAILKKEKAGYEAQANAQLQVNQVSNLTKTNEKIAGINQRLLELIKSTEKAHLTKNKETEFSIFSMNIYQIYMLAVIIEAISLLMTLSAYKQHRMYSKSSKDEEQRIEKTHENSSSPLLHEKKHVNNHELHELPDGLFHEEKAESKTKAPHMGIRAEQIHSIKAKQACTVLKEPVNEPKLLNEGVKVTKDVQQENFNQLLVTDRKTREKHPLVYLKKQISEGFVEPKFAEIERMYICHRNNVKSVLKQLETEGVIRLKNKRSYELV